MIKAILYEGAVALRASMNFRKDLRGSNAAFHSSRELVFTRSCDPGNHEFTTCQWNALLSDVTINRHEV